MLPSFPPEILDLIVDNLHNETSTLESCCLVSKSWVPRVRRILFAPVKFSTCRSPIQLWVKAFPDPRNSPAHHTRSLYFVYRDSITVASTVAPAWVRRFCKIRKLRMINTRDPLAPGPPVPLVQLCGLSSTLKSLRLVSLSTSISEVLDFICSFPLLEDLSLHYVTTQGDPDGRYTPTTSPRLTGSLHMIDRSSSLTRGLLGLPNGLHFSRVTTWCPVKSSNLPEVDLISKCSDTLEYLKTAFHSPSSFSLYLHGR